MTEFAMADLMEDFFDFSKPLERECLPCGQTQGYVEVREEDMFEDPIDTSRPSKGYSYVERFQAIEIQNQLQAAREEVTVVTQGCGLSDIDDQTSIGGSMIPPPTSLFRLEDSMQVFSQYDFRKTIKVTLPITSAQSKIMKVIDSTQTCVLQGKTGCGKSTQVPQFILDSCREKYVPCNIIVTQPRRIAAISLAKRVCAERGWELGTLVGYQVGLDSQCQSPDTRLLYCTTGTLLQKIVREKCLTTYTHIILDEVHERTQDMDFLIIVIKKLLYLNSKNVKVVLMSATFDVRQFSEYFLTLSGNNFLPAPIVDLGTMDIQFPVEIFYLCQLHSIATRLPEIRMEEPGISKLGFQVAMNLIRNFDAIEALSTPKQRGAVLVFLPGIHEIEELYNMLMASENKEHQWWVRPLHSTITTPEQEMVFKRPPDGHRKIILSTNIAESSITVPDITFVVDFVLTKHMVSDLNTNFQSLQMTWASQNSCIQRSGRAGRVAAGRVFRLVPKAFYETLPVDNIPEMKRSSLEQTVLLTKLLEMDPPKAMLALALDPPDLTRIEQTVLMLKEKGALLRTSNGRESATDGDITFLGRVMAGLPVDPIIAKLIVLGHVFSVLPDCIIMGAAMSLKSVFSTPFQERLKAYHSKLTWADSSCSDCISLLNAYKVWQTNKEVGFFKRSVGSDEVEWAHRFHIQLQTMREVQQLVQEITTRLERMNISVQKAVGRVEYSNVEKSLILKIVLAGAFYPNYFVRSSVGGQVNEKDAVKLLDGRDPFSTVYLQNFPSDQPRRLYAKRIKDALYDCCPEIRVSFDNSSKVYVQFGQHHYPDLVMNSRKYVATIPGRVPMGVYRAIKIRQLGIPIMVPLMKPAEAKKRAVLLGLPAGEDSPFSTNLTEVNEVDSGTTVPKLVLPSIHLEHMQIVITHIVDAGHFWAQSYDPTATSQQKQIFKDLANKSNIVPLTRSPEVGCVYAAEYIDESRQVGYYRARVEAIHMRPRKPMVHIFYIDYGNSATIPMEELRDFAPSLLEQGFLEVPCQSFECVMAKIQPSAIHNDTGLWSEAANRAFKQNLCSRPCFATIYSVVNSVLHVELTVDNINYNQWLIEKQFAVPAEESYLSQENHKLRVSSQHLDPCQLVNIDDQQSTRAVGKMPEYDVEPPTDSECSIRHKLRGPTSPLEMQVYSLPRVGQRREVAIDRDSVNSVLLDTYPEDGHERLLVAACVGENVAQNRITLRHTTLMPNIHGLAALICLTFAPNIELRTNAERSMYTGAICGLGKSSKTGKSMFPDHDMEVNFDTELSTDDLADINRLRLWMNECLVPEDCDSDLVSEAATLRGQVNAKETLLKLIKRKQKSIEVNLSHRPMYWGLVKPDLLMPPTDNKLVLFKQNRAVFRLHWAVRLKPSETEMQAYISKIKNSNMLKKMGAGLVTSKATVCMICEQELKGPMNLVRAHLATRTHRDEESHIRNILDIESPGLLDRINLES